MLLATGARHSLGIFAVGSHSHQGWLGLMVVFWGCRWAAVMEGLHFDSLEGDAFSRPCFCEKYKPAMRGWFGHFRPKLWSHSGYTQGTESSAVKLAHKIWKLSSNWKIKVNLQGSNEALSFLHYPQLTFSIRKNLSGMCLGHLKEENSDQDEIHWHDDSLKVHISLHCFSLCLSVPQKK